MKRAALTIVLISACTAGGVAAEEYAIRGGKVVTLAGPAIEKGTVLIRDGKIVAVGADVKVPASAKVIDATGLEVYPGLFDCLSPIGLTEISSVSATVDTSELGGFNPHLVASTAINAASEHIPVVRANGITHAVSAPGGGGFNPFGGGGSIMPGQASLVHLDGWTVEEMAIVPSLALVLNWPAISTQTFDFQTFSVRRRPFTDVKKEYDEKFGQLEDWLEAGRRYAHAAEKGSAANFDRDLKLEALARVVKGELPVIVNADDDRDIKNAVEFAEKHKLRMILAGGSEAWRVKTLLKEKNIPVILGPTLTLPDEEDDPYDKPNTRAGELFAAGVKIAFGSLSGSGPSPVPSYGLPYEAANAVSYGLPWEDALKAITLNPAQILGVADRLGSLEVGKLANVIVTTGDPLEIRTEVKHVFIQGHPVDTNNKQRRLYERYRARP